MSKKIEFPNGEKVREHKRWLANLVENYLKDQGLQHDPDFEELRRHVVRETVSRVTAAFTKWREETATLGAGDATERFTRRLIGRIAHLEAELFRVRQGG